MAKNVGQDPDLGDTAQATEQARQTSDPSNYISVSLEKYKDLEGHQADKAALVQQVKYLKKAEKERDQLREENAELVQDRANLWLQVNLLKKDLDWGIHLTQVTPRCSMRPRGGLSTRPARVRGTLRQRRGLSRLSVRVALAGGFPLSGMRA